MTRGRGLVAAGIGVVVFFVAMVPSDNTIHDTGAPGIVPLELSGGQHRADEILAEWGDEGQDAARESLWIDFGFMLSYGAFLSLASAATRDLAGGRGWGRLARIGRVVTPFGAVGAGFDALENVCLLLTLRGAGAAFPVAATVFAAGKFALVAIAIAYIAAGLAMRALGRFSPA